MREDYQTFTITWDEQVVEISYHPNWLNSTWCHVELRADDKLPVTETGYRSRFVPMTDVPDADTLRKMVRDWLDDAAHRPAWQRYQEERRQLKLF